MFYNMGVLKRATGIAQVRGWNTLQVSVMEGQWSPRSSSSSVTVVTGFEVDVDVDYGKIGSLLICFPLVPGRRSNGVHINMAVVNLSSVVFIDPSSKKSVQHSVIAIVTR